MTTSTSTLAILLAAAAMHAAAFALPSQIPLPPAPIPFNDTGFTLCVDMAGGLSPDCAGSGQDAEFGRDMRYPNPRNGAAGFKFARVCNSGQVAGFGDCPLYPVLGAGPNDWACTLDRVTGLVWEMKTTDGGLHDQSRLFTSLGSQRPGEITDTSTFVTKTNRRTLCGHSDWRIPRQSELVGIVHYGAPKPGPAIDDAFFPNTRYQVPSGGSQPIPFWTQTRFWRDVTVLSTLNPAEGSSTTLLPVAQGQARLVRGKPLQQQFEISPDMQEVQDELTGITWRRCVEGTRWKHGRCAGKPKLMAWFEALAHASAQGDGWRLPNLKELRHLLSDEGNYPCIVPPFPLPPLPYASTWSSTPYADPGITGVNAWQVDLANCIGWKAAPESTLNQVRLVRD
jgi:Protein of unknown function (DUF1566)